LTSLRQFSVLDSRFDCFEEGGVTLIRKETRLHRDLQRSSRDLDRLIRRYVGLLQEARVPLPAIVRSEAEGERLVYVCEYKGPNILQALEGLPEILKDPALLPQIFSILQKAQESHLNFDPHIKNFVVDQGVVSYVDFTPPWLPEYYEIRLSVASSEEREILTPFYRCMEPENLGYHFCSDFLKMDAANLAFMPELYRLLEKKGLIQGDYKGFLGRCEQIKNDELRRERNGVYLL